MVARPVFVGQTGRRATAFRWLGGVGAALCVVPSVLGAIRTLAWLYEATKLRADAL